MEDLGEPISYLVLKRGAEVYSSDGQRLGRVVRVEAAPEAHMFDGIVIDVKTGPGGHKFVDAPEVGQIFERGVVLKIDAAEAEDLPKPKRRGRF
jgi:PRC-barrel domain